jgi:biotin-dependent carboxylase-like uncharacterized protein
MIEVISTGPLATVQDVGRLGYTSLGVGRSGAADESAHRLANRLVGNEAAAATIEITHGEFAFRLTAAATFALTGARCPLSGKGNLAWNTALSLPAASVVTLGRPQLGLRSYLAVRGGIAVPAVLGSRSTDTLAGLGPEPLRAGMFLPLGALGVDDPADVPVAFSADMDKPVRLIAGPRQDWFTSEAWRVLVTAPWTVGQASNRIGLRLSGPILQRAGERELPSEPTLPGAVQVPPNGQPIVLGPDAPVTGGYPVIGVVVHDDLGLLAQLGPGASLRFTEQTW